MIETWSKLRVSLEVACEQPQCSHDAFPLLHQMSSGKYGECAVLPIPRSISDWRVDHRTARKRADRAHARGYVVIESVEARADEVHAINTSATRRQGRPMSAGYRLRPPDTQLPEYQCPRHRTKRVFVEDVNGLAVAYAVIIRAGQLALVSQILGHHDHLRNEIMYLLFEGALNGETDQRGFMVYNRWDSGTDGLRFFKERLGFEPREIEWAA